MLARHLVCLTASTSAVKSAITTVAQEPFMQKPTLSLSLQELEQAQRELHSSLLLLRAMIAQSSSSTQGSTTLFTATHTETLGD
jgi:hypothetical protein